MVLKEVPVREGEGEPERELQSLAVGEALWVREGEGQGVEEWEAVGEKLGGGLRDGTSLRVLQALKVRLEQAEGEELGQVDKEGEREGEAESEGDLLGDLEGLTEMVPSGALRVGTRL